MGEAAEGAGGTGAGLRYGRLAILLATGLFVANMLGAWWLGAQSSEVISRPLIGAEGGVEQALALAPQASANTHILLNRLLDAEVEVRAIQNQRALAVVAMGVAFGLMAIGFALFILGAEGAFEVEHRAGATGNVVLKATAPGLLCFLLATVVVVAALRGETAMAREGFTVYPDGSTATRQLAGGRTSGLVEGGGTAPPDRENQEHPAAPALALPPGPTLPDKVQP